jgi:hypothetical protein
MKMKKKIVHDTAHFFAEEFLSLFPGCKSPPPIFCASALSEIDRQAMTTPLMINLFMVLSPLELILL